MPEHAKRFLVVGGPNGAGKTTLANAYLAHGDWLYLGADKIAAELCPERPESVAASAGREFVERIEKALYSSKQLLVESTLSGRSIGRTIERARDMALSVRLLLPSSMLPAQVLHALLRGCGLADIMSPAKMFGGGSIAV